MEISQHFGIIVMGFVVWFFMAPSKKNADYGKALPAYMVTMMLCIEASSDLMMSRPNAFFFTVGGSAAVFFVLFMRLLRHVVYVERK
jgi:hypothetical protein